MNLLHSKTVIFTDSEYLVFDDFLKKIKKTKYALKNRGITKDSICLIEISDPLQQLITLFAVFALHAKAALINPKAPQKTREYLLATLGSHFLINEFLESDVHDEELCFDVDKLSLLLATSGSSMLPKWIVSSLKNWIKSAEGTIEHVDAKSYQSWVLSLPLFHVSGMSCVFRAFLSNAPLIISKNYTYVENARISMIPRQIEMLYQNGHLDRFMKASSILVGGSRLDYQTFLKAKHLPISITYGLTESCSQMTSTQPKDEELSCGKPLNHRKIKIDHEGFIWISGDNVCDYMWQEGKLVPLKNEDGFYKTSDHGSIDDMGNLHILGRSDERIEISGEKVYPSILEDTIKQITGGIVVVTHVHMGEKDPLIVCFLSNPPSDPQSKNIKEKLGTLFFPKYFFKLDDSTLNQKILLQELKEKAKFFIQGK